MGLIDIPLNKTGLQQAHIVAKNIADVEISHIFSSPLKRALQTSAIIAKDLLIPITVIDELKQNDLGPLEGRNKKELYRGIVISNLIEHWKIGDDIEGIEKRSDFIARVSKGLQTTLNSADAQPILIVAHGPTYWALLHILNIQNADLNAKNCGVYYFEPPAINSNQWKVKELKKPHNFL